MQGLSGDQLNFSRESRGAGGDECAPSSRTRTPATWDLRLILYDCTAGRLGLVSNVWGREEGHE